MLTRDEARERFAGAGLSYGDVCAEDVQMLRSMLDVELRRARYLMPMSEPDQRLTAHAEPGVVFVAGDGGVMRKAFMVVSWGGEAREAISFNEDGFIGFCGWASDRNAQPFLAAFVAWVDLLEAREWQRELMGALDA